MGIKIEATPGSAVANLFKPTEGEPLGVKPSLESVLAYSFRTLMVNMNVDEEKWKELMDAYLDKRGFEDRKDRTAARGNLSKELASKEMTWKVYCKGLELLGLSDVCFAVYGTGEGLGLGDANVQFRLK